MLFRQPNSLARVMHQVLDQIERGTVLTIRFGDETEAEHGLQVLHEVACQRSLGVLVTPVGSHAVELRVVDEAA